MFDRLEQIEERFRELEKELADPALVTDQQRYQKTAKQHSCSPRTTLISKRWRRRS